MGKFLNFARSIRRGKNGIPFILKIFKLRRPLLCRLNISAYGEMMAYKDRRISSTGGWIRENQIALESGLCKECSALSIGPKLAKELVPTSARFSCLQH